MKWIATLAMLSCLAHAAAPEDKSEPDVVARLAHENRVAVFQIFNSKMERAIHQELETWQSPLSDLSEKAFPSMPSSQYWKRFHENPFRAQEELSGNPLRIYGQIERIRSVNGVAVLELFGESKYRTVDAHMRRTGDGMDYVKSVSVGMAANLVCQAGEPSGLSVSASDCIYYMDALDQLVWAAYKTAMDDPSKIVRASRSAKLAEQDPGMHWILKAFTASIYAVDKIPECTPKMFVGCAESLEEAERSNKIDDWASTF